MHSFPPQRGGTPNRKELARRSPHKHNKQKEQVKRRGCHHHSHDESSLCDDTLGRHGLPARFLAQATLRWGGRGQGRRGRAARRSGKNNSFVLLVEKQRLPADQPITDRQTREPRIGKNGIFARSRSRLTKWGGVCSNVTNAGKVARVGTSRIDSYEHSHAPTLHIGTHSSTNSEKVCTALLMTPWEILHRSRRGRNVCRHCHRLHRFYHHPFARHCSRRLHRSRHPSLHRMLR